MRMTDSGVFRRGTLTAAVAALIPILAGCGQPGSAAAGPGAGPLTSAPLDAGLVTSALGYVVTTDQVLLTNDGGATFHAAQTGLPPGGHRVALFSDAAHGWVASTAGTTVTVGRTADGGRTWLTTASDLSVELTTVDVSFNGPNSGAIMAQARTGGSFSVGTVLTTGDGGATWTPHDAPVAGAISVDVDGRIWLAGGPRGDQLFTSSDQASTWTKPEVRLPAGTTVDTLAPPQDGLLPVTVTDGSASRVSLMRSVDGGASWQESASLPLSQPQARPPMSVRGHDVMVVDRGSGRLTHHLAQAGATADTRAGIGLPSGVAKISFIDAANGWALAPTVGCRNGKQDCWLTTSVVSTKDGGAIWRPVLTWVERMG